MVRQNIFARIKERVMKGNYRAEQAIMADPDKILRVYCEVRQQQYPIEREETTLSHIQAENSGYCR